MKTLFIEVHQCNVCIIQNTDSQRTVYRTWTVCNRLSSLFMVPFSLYSLHVFYAISTSLTLVGSLLNSSTHSLFNKTLACL